jgi:hypothetical protein
MKWKIGAPRTRLNIFGAIILLAGLGIASLVYWTAEDASDDFLGYEQGGGFVYPVKPGDSKKYLRDLELYGGKANVLADEFRRWFVGLWHGKSLAFTVACIAISISAVVFYVANHDPSGSESDINNKDHRDKTG